MLLMRIQPFTTLIYLLPVNRAGHEQLAQEADIVVQAGISTNKKNNALFQALTPSKKRMFTSHSKYDPYRQ